MSSMSTDQAIKQLNRLREDRGSLKAIVSRKKISPSEKAMWIVDLDYDIQALGIAIDALLKDLTFEPLPKGVLEKIVRGK
jgi:hypothetical protein